MVGFDHIKVFDTWITCTMILLEVGITVELLQKGIEDIQESTK